MPTPPSGVSDLPCFHYTNWDHKRMIPPLELTKGGTLVLHGLEGESVYANIYGLGTFFDLGINHPSIGR